MTPFDACVAALKQPGPPQTLFKTLDRALADTVGHKLFTLLYVAPNKKRVKRMYTNMPKEYPVGGYKEIGATPWHKRVVEERRAWVGHNADDIKWAYFDQRADPVAGLRVGDECARGLCRPAAGYDEPAGRRRALQGERCCQVRALRRADDRAVP